MLKCPKWHRGGGVRKLWDNVPKFTFFLKASLSENMATSDVEDPGPTTVDYTDDGTNKMDDDENTDANETANGETKARRSSRKRKQRLTIETDEIGDCDDENDPDYKS